MNINDNIAKNFWKTQKQYPKYGYIKQRRFYELNYIITNINTLSPIHSFTDIGCGDGALITCLNYLLEINSIYCYDISLNLMKNIFLDNIHKFEIDLSQTDEYTKIYKNSEIYNLGGVIQYIFDDNILYKLLEYVSKQQFKYFFLRSPCSVTGNNITINNYSDKLGSLYSSKYRTINDVLDILHGVGLKVKDYTGIYPNNIESDHGTTKQYMFFITNE